MSSSNQRRNQAAIKQFRKELQSMLDDISEIDVKVLNKAVNVGLKDAVSNTPRVTSFMAKSWVQTPAISSSDGVIKELANTANYSPYVNNGHRIVNSSGETVGFVKGQFILERAIHKVDKAIVKEFKKEIERVRKEHDK